jgi:hypothetical protein
LKLTDVAGWRSRKPVARVVNVWVSDDAADTVIDPDSRGLDVDVVVAAVVEVEHALATTARRDRAARAAVRLIDRLMRGRPP